MSMFSQAAADAHNEWCREHAHKLRNSILGPLDTNQAIVVTPESLHEFEDLLQQMLDGPFSE